MAERGDLQIDVRDVDKHIIVRSLDPNTDHIHYKLVKASLRMEDLQMHPDLELNLADDIVVIENCPLLEGNKHGLYIKVTEPMLPPEDYRWSDQFHWIERLLFVKFLIRDEHAFGYVSDDEGYESQFSHYGDSDDEN